MTHLLADLGWVDFDLGCSTGHWAVLQLRCCPSKTVEHLKFKSTQPRSTRTWDALYKNLILALNDLPDAFWTRRQLCRSWSRRTGRARYTTSTPAGTRTRSARREMTSRISAQVHLFKEIHKRYSLLKQPNQHMHLSAFFG